MTVTVNVIETVQYRTPLAVAFHDLVTDEPVTDGLQVSARRAGDVGRFREGRSTPSGVHVLAGLPALRAAETPHPLPGERADADDLPSAETVPVEVLVTDRARRFLPTVVLLAAPLDRVATAADALAGSSQLLSLPDDTPMFLMSAPTRSLARTTAVLRADLREHATGAPAAHAVLVVEAAGRRAVGVADGDGNVVVAFPYPDFAAGAGVADSIPAGAHGTPTFEQQWPVTVSARWQRSALELPEGVDVPYVHTIAAQDPALLFDDDAGPGQASLAATLTYGSELALATGGVTDRARASSLFVEPAP